MDNFINLSQLSFEKQCIIDVGKIFYYNEHVYRLINDEELCNTYKELLNNDFFSKFEKLGLVKTKLSNLKIENYPNSLILEHEKLRYFLHPTEFTNKMFYDAALQYIELAKELIKNGYVFQDGHSYNITFKNGDFKYFDFTSIRKGEHITQSWLHEFYIYFAVPIFLASRKSTYNFASLYRKEHYKGIGIKLANTKYVRKLFFRRFWKNNYLLMAPELLLNKIEAWIKSHPPISPKGYWDNYEQAHYNNEEFNSNESTIKQKFVFDILSKERKRTLIDLACNKGYYSSMADYLGYEVIALDYEEYPINYAIENNRDKNITFANLDFTYPTPSYGWGNIGLNSFERLQSDMGLALGLIHHVCLKQGFPVKLFCETCMNYCNDGILLEFIYPEDLHVAKWNETIPDDYNLNNISHYFHKKFPNIIKSELMETGGTKRQFIYFYK